MTSEKSGSVGETQVQEQVLFNLATWLNTFMNQYLERKDIQDLFLVSTDLKGKPATSGQ
jgi:hypothetical protein